MGQVSMYSAVIKARIIQSVFYTSWLQKTNGQRITIMSYLSKGLLQTDRATEWTRISSNRTHILYAINDTDIYQQHKVRLT